MSGVWVFKNGVVRLVENPGSDYTTSFSVDGKVLFFIPTKAVIASYDMLEMKLVSLGWERQYNDTDLLQFKKQSSTDLISIPKDFSSLTSVHFYDIMIKNREAFRVVDVKKQDN
ncbi:hypothetical protein LUZ61_003613 [Rhynchospora tenuis]|uniref:Uncharacterized protein n=1 Tax=Rhynchospora tenuis TaxID=198213 RepID=A0AAD5ZL99_9POAL|nr:hypothetical protein LUZ61_003613 [Rhynchospora tenuis]